MRMCLIVDGGATDVVIGVEQDLSEQCANVPPTLAETREPLLRPVLARHRGPAARDRGQTGDVELRIT